MNSEERERHVNELCRLHRIRHTLKYVRNNLESDIMSCLMSGGGCTDGAVSVEPCELHAKALSDVWSADRAIEEFTVEIDRTLDALIEHTG